ncbi:transposase family protein [Streptomyces yokosukanensis]|uniref:transposase family protein n=1 Tax=Streptomyces yokosukanensis TaxID=67386 RepID=UPI001FC9ADB7|nr:transposase family protein [Streptomyces yokosukanensis]
MKTTTLSDPQGRTLFSGVVRPGRMHDQTAVRTEGIAEQFHRHPKVKAEVDEGYRGLANEFPGQVSAPPQGEHGTGARPAGRLLITHQPTRGRQAPNSIVPKVVKQITDFTRFNSLSPPALDGHAEPGA